MPIHHRNTIPEMFIGETTDMLRVAKALAIQLLPPLCFMPFTTAPAAVTLPRIQYPPRQAMVSRSSVRWPI